TNHFSDYAILDPINEETTSEQQSKINSDTQKNEKNKELSSVGTSDSGAGKGGSSSRLKTGEDLHIAFFMEALWASVAIGLYLSFRKRNSI
ncbi:MAG: hypothetical protein IJ758_02485, partial [Clostridia bacterium]|nr:hypothetical protein [Clostridia bacterium]